METLGPQAVLNEFGHLKSFASYTGLAQVQLVLQFFAEFAFPLSPTTHGSPLALETL